MGAPGRWVQGSLDGPTQGPMRGHPVGPGIPAWTIGPTLPTRGEAP